jgi:hypothetical protein
MRIDAASGLIQWTPVTGQVGSHNVSVRVQDAGGLFALQPFVIRRRRRAGPGQRAERRRPGAGGGAERDHRRLRSASAPLPLPAATASPPAT